MSDLLGALARNAQIAERTVLVAAHPDDEILGLGSRLQDQPRLSILHLTDGAPRNPGGEDACNGWQAYARRRDAELSQALAVAGAKASPGFRYGYPDQRSILHVRALVGRLAADLAGAHAVITHPYEHGHPDHDTAALAVALACGVLEREGRPPPARFEFASYHLRYGRPVYGAFWPSPGCKAISIRLTPSQAARKRAALDCFQSQRDVIRRFSVCEECVRTAPAYDFRQPAPPGAALYDEFGWAMTSLQWRALASGAVEAFAGKP